MILKFRKNHLQNSQQGAGGAAIHGGCCGAEGGDDVCGDEREGRVQSGNRESKHERHGKGGEERGNDDGEMQKTSFQEFPG